MKIISVNLGAPTRIQWNGKVQITGIYKYPTEKPIYLEKESVAGDTIADRRVHGGSHKACYLFSADYYPYWRSKYPDLTWNWGMFGENLTIEGMDEDQLRIGDKYRIGGAKVEVTMPREPCYKLGIRFGTQKILKEFIAYNHPGTYVRVLQKGEVKAGELVILEHRSENPLTVSACFQLYYSKVKNRELLELALGHPALPQDRREFLRKYI